MRLSQFTLLFVGLFISTNFYSHGTFQALNFTENRGQHDARVQFHCKLHIGDLYLEKNGFTFDMFSAKELDYYYNLSHDRKGTPLNNSDILKKHAYKMSFQNANPNPVLTTKNKMEGYKNYYIGNDPSKWASNVNSYGAVQYENLYPNIDLEIYTSVSQIKYDFIVKKGGNASQIKIDYTGTQSLFIDENGYLTVVLSNGEVKESKPIAFQNKNGKQISVSCNYKLIGNTVTFEFPNGYDSSVDLIIDPVLVFSTLTGSTADNWGFTATYDSQGNAYGGGIAFSAGYPTTTGAYQTTFGGIRDIAITKYTPNGNALLFSTYLGGNNADVPHSLVNDSQDNLIILGSSGSSNYPTTGGCYDPSFNGGANFTGSNGIPYSVGADAIITKLNANGTALLGSTFIGGSANDGINQSISTNYSDEARGEVVVDAFDNVYVTCSSRSTNFPTTAGSHSLTNAGNQDAVVFKMNPLLTTLIWSSYFGGSGNDAGYSIRVAPNGNVYICGGAASNNIGTTTGVVNPTYGGGTFDGYVASFNGTTGSLLAATYLGTSSYDQAFILEVDDNGDVFVVGQTKGVYPVFNAPYSINNSAQFIHKLNGNLNTTIFSMLFGDGSRTTIDISITAFLVDNCGNLYVAGWGGSINDEGTTNGLPITANAIKTTTDGSDFYFIVIEKNSTSLLYGSYFGSNSIAEHVDGGTSRFDKNGTIYQAACAGCGGGQSFPTTPGVWSNSNGSSNCNLGVVKINLEFQGIEADAVVPPDIFLCSSPFTVNFTGNNPAPPHSVWNFGDGNFSLLNNPTHTFADTGDYVITYVVIDSASCNIADTAFFNVSLTQPEQFSATFNVPTVDPCDGIDSLLVSLQFTGTGADSLIWNMGNGVTFIDVDTVNYYYTNTGVYEISLIAIDNVCNHIDTLTTTVNYILNYLEVDATVPPDITLCSSPYVVSFSGNTPAPPNSLWNFGDGNTSLLNNPTHTYADTGTYEITYIVIDSTTCNIADTAIFNVTLIQPEQFSATFNVPTIDPCEGIDSLLVALQFTGTGADSLIWNMGNGDVFTDVNSVNYYYTNTGVYEITLIAIDNVCNHIDTLSTTVNYILNYSQAVANVPDDVFLCTTPLNVDFSTGNPIPPHVFWDFGDGIGTSTLPTVTYTYGTQGTYEVMYIAIDSSTCNIADTAYFTVELTQAEQFSAEFSFQPPPRCGSDSVLVELVFTGSGADQITWNMGNGDVFNTDSVYYYYTEAGTYTISMTAVDNVCNNTQTISEQFTFVGNVVSTSIIPNIFTPNGDGMNDLLKILNVDFSDNYSMTIFNRWGNKVFETTDSTEFWDGKDKSGSNASEGVYFFEIIYKDICSEEEKIETGHVNLVR